jgi:pSer/pThr/pTyr-binding forkhead associated (FHA) protein
VKVALVIIRGGKFQGRRIPLRQLPFVIGRHPDCNLRPAHPTISKIHCALEVEEGQLVLRDHDSTNGTAINGHTFRGGTIQILDRDEVSVGPLTFIVHVQSATPADVGERVPAEEEVPAEHDDAIPSDEMTEEMPPSELSARTDDTEETSALTINEHDVLEDDTPPVRKKSGGSPPKSAPKKDAAEAAQNLLRAAKRKSR